MACLAFALSRLRPWALRAALHATSLAITAFLSLLAPSVAFCDFPTEPCNDSMEQNSFEQVEPAVPSLVNGGLSVFQRIEPQLKSDFELDEYFMMHLKDDKTFINWMRYKTSIREAAEAFQIPFPFLACLLAKESRFKSQEVSRKGARGLAQILPNTLRSISKIIKKVPNDPLHAELYSIWKELWKGTWRIEPPTEMNQSAASQPLHGIAGAALWSRYHFLLQSGRISFMTDIQNLDTLEMLSASYNMGDHGFLKKCGKKSTAAACRSRFKAGTETAQQMWSVRTCMEHGNESSLFARMPR